MPIADPSARHFSAASPFVVVGEGHAPVCGRTCARREKGSNRYEQPYFPLCAHYHQSCGGVYADKISGVECYALTPAMAPAIAVTSATTPVIAVRKEATHS